MMLLIAVNINYQSTNHSKDRGAVPERESQKPIQGLWDRQMGGRKKKKNWDRKHKEVRKLRKSIHRTS